MRREFARLKEEVMFCFLLQDDYFKFYSIERWRCDERWKAEEEEERDLLRTHHSALAECRPLAGGRGSEETRNSGLCSLPHPGIPKGPPSPPLSSGNRKRKWEPVSWLPLSNARGQVTPSADSGEGRHCGNKQFWRCCRPDCPTGDPSRVTVRMSGKDRIEIFPSRM